MLHNQLSAFFFEKRKNLRLIKKRELSSVSFLICLIQARERERAQKNNDQQTYGYISTRIEYSLLDLFHPLLTKSFID